MSRENKKIKTDWKEKGTTSDGKCIIFTNGDMFVPVLKSLVDIIRKDAFDLGVDTGVEKERATKH